MKGASGHPSLHTPCALPYLLNERETIPISSFSSSAYKSMAEMIWKGKKKMEEDPPRGKMGNEEGKKEDKRSRFHPSGQEVRGDN